MTGVRCLLVLLIGLAVAAPAGAGIYFTDEEPQLPLPNNAHQINFNLIDLRTIPADDKDVKEDPPIRKHYRGLLARLQEKERAGLLSFSDRIDLGACYLMHRKYREAKPVLEEAERLCEADNIYRFLLLANLAVTYQGLAEMEQQANYYDQAVSYQKQALKAWPEIYPRWLRVHGQIYRRCEVFYLRLLETRRNETRKTPGLRGFQWQQPDDLFEGVSFVGLGDEYQAGRIPPALWDKLPPDAPQIVVQLLYWFPYDDRLYWLFGEVLNANNQVVEAYGVFDQLVGPRKIRFRELMQHHRTLEEPARGRMKLAELQQQRPATLQAILQAAAPQGGTMVLGPAAGAVQAVFPAFVAAIEASEAPLQPQGQPPANVRETLDWNAFFVAFTAGAIVGVLALMQLRQWRLRRGDSINERRLQDG